MILLDTNVAIAIMNDVPLSVRQRYRAAQDGDEPIGMSSIVLFELYYGVFKSRHSARNLSRINDFLMGSIEVIDFDAEDAAKAGELRQHLRSIGTPIGSYDMLIAGQALKHAATLVTNNTNEFSRVPGLVLEDWSRE